MTRLIQLLNWAKENKALIALAGSALVHLYQVVVRAGGVKRIYQNFVEGEGDGRRMDDGK